MTQGHFDPQPSHARLHTRTRMITILFLVMAILLIFLGVLMRVRGVEAGGIADLDFASHVALVGIFLLMSGLALYQGLAAIPARLKNKARKVADPRAVPALLHRTHALRVANVSMMAVYGLILFLITGNLLSLLLFDVVAIALLLYLFPTRAKWEQTLA